MRILFTVSTYLPQTNGVQYVTSYLAEGLVKRGHSVDVITYLNKDNLNKEEWINGVHILRWEATTVHMFHRGDKEGFQKYILEHQNKYDVMLQVGTQAALTDWLLPILHKITIPKLLHIHSVWDFKINKCDCTSLKRLILKLVGNLRWGGYFLANRNSFKLYDGILQLHEKDYSVSFMKHLCGKESIILNNAVDEQFFANDACKKESTIIYVANYSDMKNQKRALEIFEKAKIPKGWKLILIGSKENEYVKELRDKANKIMSEKDVQIEILVGVSREDTIRYVKQSEVYLMTSRREAFPISISEAMASGIPFISTDVGIVKHLPGGTVCNSICQQVDALEKYVFDAEMRHKVGMEGKQFAVENMRICSKIEQLEKNLEKLI